MDGLIDRRLIEAPFSGDPACLLGLTPPLRLGQFSQPLFEEQAVLLGELLDSVKDLAHSLGHFETSSQPGLGIVAPAPLDENYSRRRRAIHQAR
jgi:hypothetical protein